MPISTQLEMPELINESVPRGAHFDSINSAIAYLSLSFQMRTAVRISIQLEMPSLSNFQSTGNLDSIKLAYLISGLGKSAVNCRFHGVAFMP
jgi:hypothetical protein